MAFKLDKQDKARRDGLVKDLNEKRSALEAAVTFFNAEVANLKTPVEEALAKYNEVVEEARGFAEDIANQADSDISEKSDKWQEGERGEAASAWKEEWEGADLGELEITFPDDLSLEGGDDHAATLEQLPEAAG